MSASYLSGTIKRYWLLPWVAFAPVLLGQANTASQNGQGAAGELEQLRSALAVRVERAPKLDGTLNDLWQQASPASDLLQREPFEGRTPTERTEVRVLYTRTAVFFGVNCLDPNPDGIVKSISASRSGRQFLGARGKSADELRVFSISDSLRNRPDEYG